MAFELRICPICGREFCPASEHALTDYGGKQVCSPHCNAIAYDRKYGKKKRKKERTEFDESERQKEIYERIKKKGASGERRKRFMKAVLVIKKEDGSIMSRYPSVKAASEATGVSATRISEVCRGGWGQIRGKYTFIFEREEFRPKEDGEAIYNRPPAFKPVLQFNLRGEFIARHESQSEAALATGCSQSGVSACCNHRQYQTGGFVFMFESEFKEFEKNGN